MDPLSKINKAKISYKKYYETNKVKIQEKRKLKLNGKPLTKTFKVIQKQLEKKLIKIYRIKKLII